MCEHSLKLNYTAQNAGGDVQLGQLCALHPSKNKQAKKHKTNKQQMGKYDIDNMPGFK